MPMVMSAGLGVAIGLCYGGSSVLVAEIALRQDTRTFLSLYVGGILFRMLLALAAVVATVVWLDADLVIFLGSLLGTLLLTIVLEIVWLTRRQP